ncbi:hypothetical protein NDK43_25930 [Neobacillus pocheonensis]|uniref:Uncharacterized protein n=1 Tax=Neobacillus pocheonensis TaxID=363869 RepID=A0ABT0WFS8_9BACI|nr:hypothetical protein [Neobacillus pocheonensis]
MVKANVTVQKEYKLLEYHILNIFKSSTTFTFDGINYHIEEVDKPKSPGGGEPKTDCYVLGRNGSREKELKISIKLLGKNEFQGNKLRPVTAESYFGEEWAEIVEKATRSVKYVIENQPLIFRKEDYPTQEDSITLGWKLEISDKYRPLSSPIPLTDRQIRDYVYKGTKLPQHQKNARINGKPVPNSGIADYIIYTTRDKVKNVNDIINQLQDIDIAELQDTYLIFTANNYRTREHKWDNKRYLSVIVNWSQENGVLVPSYDYSRPLSANTETSLPRLLDILKKLPSPHPTEMNDCIIHNPSLIYG